MGERGNWADGILRGIGDAIGDVRSKLVEEGWFGRREVVPAATQWWTPERSDPARGFSMPKPSFDEAWAPREREPMRDIPHQGEPAFGTDAWFDWANDVTHGPAAEAGLGDFEQQWAVRDPGETERSASEPDHGIDR